MNRPEVKPSRGKATQRNRLEEGRLDEAFRRMAIVVGREAAPLPGSCIMAGDPLIAF